MPSQGGFGGTGSFVGAHLHATSMMSKPPSAPSGHLPHCASIHGLCGGKGPLVLSPRPSGRGDARSLRRAGGRLRRRGAPQLRAIRGLIGGSELPEPPLPCRASPPPPSSLGENVRERRQQLHPDREEPETRESQTPPRERTVPLPINRGSRLRGGECQRAPARTFTQIVKAVGMSNPCPNHGVPPMNPPTDRGVRFEGRKWSGTSECEFVAHPLGQLRHDEVVGVIDQFSHELCRRGCFDVHGDPVPLVHVVALADERVLRP